MRTRSGRDTSPENMKNWFALKDEKQANEMRYVFRKQDPKSCESIQYMWDTLKPINTKIESEHVIIPLQVIVFERNLIYAVMKIVFGETTIPRKQGLKLNEINRETFKLKPNGRLFYYRVFHDRFLDRESPRGYNLINPVKQLRKIKDIQQNDKLYTTSRVIDCDCENEQDCMKEKRKNEKILKRKKGYPRIC